MAQTNKLKAAFCACTGSFSFREFERLLRSLGYAEVKTGRSGGSRRRYFNEETKHIVMLHEGLSLSFRAYQIW